MIAITLALMGCKTPEEVVEPEPELLAPTAALSRASLDLRGRRPTPDELRRIGDDPDAYDAMVADFLGDDAALEQRLVYVFQEMLHTRSEGFQVLDAAVLEDPEAFLDAVGQEPLRLMAKVAVEDLPWTEVLQADWTVLNDTLASQYPVDWPQGASGWTKVQWNDGRPAAGVLSTNGLYWRFPSTASNKQRKRANQISRVFTCRDFLGTEIPFDDDIDLLNEEAVANAIRDNPSCAGCHDDLDPIASYLWGFNYGIDDGFTIADAAIYHPERERSWEDETEVEPGWYGQRGSTLADLGHQIAADTRFVQCAVERATETMLRRPLDGDDSEMIARHRAAFLDGGLTYRSLLESIVTDEMYRSDADDPRVPSRKWMPPDLMASQIEALTGFRWTGEQDRDVLGSEAQGLLTLAGGLDGATVTAAADRPNTTVLLVQDRLATAAATWVVAEEPGRADPRLFTVLSPEDAGSPEVHREQIVELQAAVLGRLVETDDASVTAYLELYDHVLALDEGPETAWAAVLTAMFRDPDFAAY